MNDEALETSAELATALREIDPAAEPVRISNLKRMALSPAHYLSTIVEPRKQSAAMRMGKLGHSLILGGTFVVYEGERRGKAWTAFKAEHAGEEIVTAAEHDVASRMRDSVYRHRHAPRLLAGEHEREIAWNIGGRACLSHVDVIGETWVTELKTSHTTKPDRFNRLGVYMGYHAQLAWYLDACAFADLPRSEAYVVAVEVAPPFAVTVMQLTARAIDEGRKLCRIWLEQLLVCEQSKAWPAYCDSIVDFDVPDDVNLLIDGEEVAA